MRYFEIAERETKKTETEVHPDKTESDFTIYSFHLFEKAFWDGIGRDADEYPLDIYETMWSVRYEVAVHRGSCAICSRTATATKEERLVLLGAVSYWYPLRAA